MATIFINESQKNKIRCMLEGMHSNSAHLNENKEGKIYKKVCNYIREYCNNYVSGYLDTPLSEINGPIKEMCNPVPNQESGLWVLVKNAPEGTNRFIDFLKFNLLNQFGINHGSGPFQYAPGIARIACKDLGFYSFDPRIMKGGDIIRFGKILKLISREPETMLEGINLDSELNGMDFNQFESLFANKVDNYTLKTNHELDSDIIEKSSHKYTIISLTDSIDNRGMAIPDSRSKNILNNIGKYTDWCICGQYGIFEYAQYVSSGGKFYICLRDDYESIPKEIGENCPLDDYGLSMIAVIVGTDGLPDNITTRWNHENDGENNENLWNAIQLQKVLGVNYRSVFKPRNTNELNKMHICENRIYLPKKVNSAIMDSVSIEEGAEPESDSYGIGFKEEYAHVCEEKDKNRINGVDYKKRIAQLANFMKEEGLNVYPFPKVKFDWDEQDGLFIKTGYYEPQSKTIHLFCKDRHIKDILRTFAHEMIHHSQNLNGKNLNFTSNDDVKDNKELEKLEGEAYLKGNIYFRKWTEYMQSKGDINECKIINEIADISDLNVLPCKNYYKDAGAREICHKIKEGNYDAIEYAASIMANYVDNTNILVPIPSRNGTSTTTLALAKCIAKLSGAKVVNSLKGKSRNSLYDLKLSGFEANDEFFGYSSDVKGTDEMVLVDNVLDTGSTARAAANATGIKNILVFAKTDNTSLEESINAKNLKYGININVDENDWIKLIFDKKKTIETRGGNTYSQWAKHKGETVGIVKTTKNPTKSNPTGLLVGQAKIQDVILYDDESFERDKNKHLVNKDSYFSNGKRCGLVLTDVEKLDFPIKLKGAGQQAIRPITFFDNINEDTNPDSISLSSFKIQKELNPKFWKNNKLDSRVRKKLLDIAYDFIEFIGPVIKNPKDIIMTGSLANFNWNKKYSDIDLHILVDFSKIDKRKDFVKKYFDSQKNLWNNKHSNISILGFTVELYVQDVDEINVSSGVYSIENNKWITEPDKKKFDESLLDSELVKKKVAKFIDEIDSINDKLKKENPNLKSLYKSSNLLKDKIKKERIDSLSSTNNELSNGNIVFKCLRRLGYIDKLFNIRDEIYDKMNSL